MIAAQNKQVKRTMQVVVAMLCLFAVTAGAQYRDWIGEEETANSRWVPKLKYILTDMDGEKDTFKTTVGGTQEVTRFYGSPRIAVGWDNFIYHPNLLMYTALFEPGYTWRRTSVNGFNTDSSEVALDGKLDASLLSAKPYATTLTFDRGNDEVQYGFFNTASIDSQTWGLTTGYRNGPIPVHLTFSDSRESAEEFFQNTSSEQRVLDFTGLNERKNNGVTSFLYQYTGYDRNTDIGGHSISNDSSNHRVELQDTEHFERSMLRSTFRVANRESNGAEETDFTGSSTYELDLTERLHNFYEGTYSQYASDGFGSKQGYASAGLRHQLYESLSSTIEAHGNWTDSTFGGASTQTTSGGMSLSEDYSKQLGSWGRLSISFGTTFDLNHQNSSGGLLLIPNETHVVPANLIVTLKRPRAIVVISVTDSNNIPLDATDFTVNKTSEPWQIQISPLSTRVQAGASIQVTYSIENNPNNSTTAFSQAAQVRLSFWNELASIYARYSFTDNHASTPDIIVDNEDFFQTGATFTWNHLVLNADYTDQRSTFFTLKTFNLSESYSVDVMADSTLGIDLQQQWGVNASGIGPAGIELRQHSSFYDFMLTYDWRPWQSFNWKNEIGYQYQTGFAMNQKLFAARSYLNWLVGKIQVNAGYEHEDVDFLHQSKTKDYVFLKLRRSF